VKAREWNTSFAESFAEDKADARAKECKRKPTDNLICLQSNHNIGMDLTNRASKKHSCQYAEPRVTGLDRDTIARHRTDKHHAFNTKIEDAGTFSEQLAHGGE
jgi:hypothetical protein